MNKSTNRDATGRLLTIKQMAELSNLGISTVRKVAVESRSVRKIGRCVRINCEQFLSFIEENYS